MKISLNWLNDFIDLHEIYRIENVSSKLDLAKKIASRLTGVGFEVEEIIEVDKFLKNVVVGKINKITKHEQADKLFVCDVNIGEKNVQIITSATNVFEGAIVPVALDGAELANGIKIKNSKIRGVISEGMFCSGEELGINDNFYDGASINGILIFKDNFINGQPIGEALFLNDIVLDVSITANRPDAMSVIGIAREISAIYKIKIKNPDLSFVTDDIDVKDRIEVTVEDEFLCPRYMASSIHNIKIKKSPLNFRARLFSVGVNPINNVVDITNYVLFEYGQPMHAFDLNNINGRKIIVRKAKEGETIFALNNNEYNLSENNLVIADKDKPMVIAGVIGGVDSCINEQTSEIVFESACFERSQIRRTSRKFGIRTDSSARYEKGIDLSSQELGLKRALNLIYSFDVGKICNGIIDINNADLKEKSLSISINKIHQILGIKVEINDIVEILENLSIKTIVDDEIINIKVPLYRSDIENENDVAEEIIRMFGYNVYDSATKKFLDGSSVMIGKYNKILTLQREIKNILIYKGYYEINSYSLVPSNVNKNLLLNDLENEVVKIKNPISDELSCLRISMAHSLLSNINYNLNRGNKNFRTFESGKTFHAKQQPITELPLEKNILAFASVNENDNFYTIKGIVENILNKYDIDIQLEYSKLNLLHPGISADVINTKTDEVLISFGQINPKVAANYDIPEFTLYCEIDCDKLAKLQEKSFSVKRISKFPIVERDLAIVVNETIKAGDIQQTIKQCCGKFFNDIELFDIYRNKQILGDKKSLAYRIKLSSYEKTLEEEEIIKIINKIIKRLEDLFGAELRK